ncbi:MAG TPA: DUF4175 family protein, partial [Vicinamibacterales bacterium]|nr:DUF4175 family protein [Vicinamibacterales bacterium]
RALSAATAGAVAAMALVAAVWLGALPRSEATAAGLAVVAVGAISGAGRAWRTRRAMAHEIERRRPAFQNLLVTANELVDPRRPGAPVRPELRDLVLARAAALTSGIDLRSLMPLTRPVITFTIVVAAWVTLAAVVRDPAGPAPGRASAAAPDAVPPAIARIEIVATPPAYTGLEVVRLVDPDRVEVVAGTRLDVRVVATGTRLRLGTLDAGFDLEAGDGGVFTATVTADADGLLTFEPSSALAQGARRLVGLVVRPDQLPAVRIVEPAQDLFLPDATRTIPVALAAEDDFGLASLRLTFTRVSGSGETFTFTDGEVPVRLERARATAWTARAELALADLGLALGDTLVYRAWARDTRPGAPEVESDAFLVEIIGPGAAVAGGFAVDDDEARQGLSQQMVIVKTEALLARRATMAAADYADEARRLAAEQRMVRAAFVFMMGGEIADEVEEAEHSHEIAEGRLEHRGRIEMMRAVVAMSQAATALANADLDAALPLERAALDALQRALLRSRYILRTLADRERVDPARRLTGEPITARAPRGVVRPAPDPETDALRRILADAAAVAARGDVGAEAARTLVQLAETTLRLAPSVDLIQRASADFAEAARLVGLGERDAARARLQSVIEALTGRVRGRLPVAPARRDIDPALAGALADHLARGGGQ